MSAHLVLFWSLLFPGVFAGVALIMVGAYRGIKDGRFGEPFLFTRPYRKWSMTGLGLIILVGIGLILWLITLPN